MSQWINAVVKDNQDWCLWNKEDIVKRNVIATKAVGRKKTPKIDIEKGPTRTPRDAKEVILIILSWYERGSI